jgi:heat shock protein HtpX
MPKIYVTPAMQPNAFATGRSPRHAAVAVTKGILQILDQDELRAVVAHELSHVRNRDVLIGSVAAAISMGITFIARMAMFGAMFGGRRRMNPISLVALVLLAPLAAMVMQPAVSRSREYQADLSGAELIGNGEPLARALLKIQAPAQRIPMNVDPAHATAYIVNPLSGRKVSFGTLFSTHPSTEQRIARLEAYRPETQLTKGVRT